MVTFCVFSLNPDNHKTRDNHSRGKQIDGVHARGAGTAAEHARGGVHPPRFAVHATPVSNRQNATDRGRAVLCERRVHARRSPGTATAVSLLLHAAEPLILVERYCCKCMPAEDTDTHVENSTSYVYSFIYFRCFVFLFRAHVFCLRSITVLYISTTRFLILS